MYSAWKRYIYAASISILMENQTSKGNTIEGKLEAIIRMDNHPIYDSNGICGPGYHSWKIGQFYTTTFLLKRDGQSMEFSYEGFLLPDSIGNNMKITLKPESENHGFLTKQLKDKKRTWVAEIYDKTLDRTYGISYL